MPPRVVGPPRKEACVIIIDVGKSMGRGADEEKGSGLDHALHAVKLMIQQKLLFTRQDELGLVLVGTDETDNDLAAEDGGSYEHVTVLKQLQKPDLQLLETINSIEASNCTRGDCIDALLVAMHMLHARVGKLRFQKRIFLITDCAAPIVDDPAAMEAIADGMRRDEFKLNVIGVGFKEDDEEDEGEDGERVQKKEEGGDDDGEEEKHGGAAAASSSAAAAAAAGGAGVHVKKEMEQRTSTQRTNESLLKRFASAVDGVVFNAQNAIDMLSVFRSRSVNQVTKFRGNLQLSAACNIPVWAYGKTALMNMPPMKKESALAGGGGDGDGDGEAAAAAGGGWGGGGGGGGWGGGEDGEGDGGEGGGFAGAGGDDGKVQMERLYLNKLGEREKEVPADMRIRSFRYGKEQVPFAEEDLEQLKFQTEKGIKILSFVPQKSIPRHHYIANVDCIVAEPGDFSAALSLSALIHACYDTAKVAVVRYVKRNNDRPLLGILIPVVKADVECFYWNQLPFEEDIREYSFASLDDVAVTSNQRRAAEELVRSMNLMTAARDDDGDPTEALVPKHTFNPALQRFYQCVERRALDPAADISELDPSIARYIVPDPSLLRQAAPKLNNFRAAFDLRPVEQKEKKQKRHWKDWYSSEVAQDAEMDAMRKRQRAEGEGAAAAAAAAGGVVVGMDASQDSRSGGASSFSLESAVADVVDAVGAVRPVADFKAMLARRDDPTAVSRALEQMGQRIRETLDQSLRGHLYPRALECLQAMRAGAVQMEDADRFNTLLQWLKSTCAPTPAKPHPKHEDFYAQMRNANVLPIHEGEVAAARVTEAEARNFFEAEVEESVSAPVAAPPAADDALFDSME